MNFAKQIAGIVIVKSKSNHVYVIDSHERELKSNVQLTISGDDDDGSLFVDRSIRPVMGNF